MTWWLYDEGGWPSGQALGKVIEGRPDLVRRAVARKPVPGNAPFTVPSDALALVTDGPNSRVVRPGEVWTPSTPADTAYLYCVASGSGVDLLNPNATDRFIELTHAAYAKVIPDALGKTVRFTFTDEPSAGMPNSPKYVPWFDGLEQAYRDRAGRDLLSDLPNFFVDVNEGCSEDVSRAKVALFDAVTQRYADAYFGKLKDWARQNGLASGGHLGGDDETLGVVKYGYGHLLRQLRRFDVPGVDLIWRQLFPGRGDQSNFPIAAASVAHQNGTRFAFSESFCVYGNGLTPAQMKWLVDYQYLRGINLLVLGCYPMSARDHHMTGERPHFGAMNPLWDHLAGFHGYVARLGYALSVGTPVIRTAVYMPVRDMWALGTRAKDAVDTFEAIERELLARQCPFDLIDDDMLTAAHVDGATLVVGAMRYDTVLCGAVKWMAPAARERITAFASAGGRVAAVGQAPGVDGQTSTGESAIVASDVPDIAARAVPGAHVTPACRDLRAAIRETQTGRVVVLFNEGNADYRGALEVGSGNVSDLDLMSGELRQLECAGGRVPLNLPAGATTAMLVHSNDALGREPRLTRGESITIAPESVHAVKRRQFVVGEHEFEMKSEDVPNAPFSAASRWSGWLGEDFSGEVEYQFEFEVPPAWSGSSLMLTTGAVEYAASVCIDGARAGELLWPPWEVRLPACSPGKHRIAIRVANTLANELTSDRVTQLWAQKSGPGWPSPYHKRALVFERESRGGGIEGPIRVTPLVQP